MKKKFKKDIRLEKKYESLNKKKVFSWKKHLFVLGITLLIFTFGVLIGNYSSVQKLSSLRNLQDDLRTQTLDAEMQYNIVQEDPCVFTNTSTLSQDLYDLSTRLDFMENILGKDDKQVKSMKSYYSLLELRQWLFLKRINKECNINQTLILYFYSNKEGKCPKCEEQGFILTWLRKNYPEVQIFSFDIDLPLNTLKSLEKRYEINETPFIVMNEVSYKGFQTKNTLLLATLKSANRTIDSEALRGIKNS